jgi:hypothetical protein
MRLRIEQELTLLRKHDPSIEALEHDGVWWFRLRNRTLPTGWTPATVEIAFREPQGYPGTNPYGFYVSPPPRLTATNQHSSNNYREPEATPFGGTWGFFSWEPDGSWKPGATPETGSNLTDFVRSFADRFREVL